jgi:predicted nucleic acid-binding protein
VPPDSPATARAKIDAIARLPYLTVLPIDRETVALATAVSVEKGVTRQAYYDMQIVGTMRQYGIALIFTENAADFVGVEGVEAVNPFA